MSRLCENLPFKYCGSVAVLCDLWTPEGEPPAGGWPLVLFFHAGGWVYGNKSFWRISQRWKETLLDRGVAFASVGYRHRAYGGKMPTPVADAADAVRFFRKNAAEYGIDPERILLSGHSAGGHLALLVGFTGDKFRDNYSDKETECRVCGAVSLAGPANLRFSAYDKPKFNPDMSNCLQGLLGDKWEDPEALAEAEPISYVQRGEAIHIPVLCVASEDDEVVPPGMSADLCRAGKEHGYDIRRLLLHECDHGFNSFDTRKPSPAAYMADGEICNFVLEVFGMENAAK